MPPLFALLVGGVVKYGELTVNCGTDKIWPKLVNTPPTLVARVALILLTRYCTIFVGAAAPVGVKY